MIHNIIASKLLTIKEMAHEAKCSERIIIDISKYLQILADVTTQLMR
jgi:hypothetical protein